MRITVMKYRWIFIWISVLFTLPLLASEASASTEKAPAAEQGEQAEKGVVEIKPEGQKSAGIKTELLTLKRIPTFITAHGEVFPNGDQSAIVSPRIDSQVVARLVQVGDQVIVGQPLVKLTSVEMANAQATLLLAFKEWQRARSLGEQAVSAKRYQEAEIAYQQASSKLLAYGMTQAQIDVFLQSNSSAKANGEYELLTHRAGTIFSADFTEGQTITAGTTLFRIVDESNLWVDARLSNGDVFAIKRGADVIIATKHGELKGTVLQIHHQLDETTRTQSVRILVPNPNDLIHPGQFVTCHITRGETAPILAIPLTAIIRGEEGEQLVYTEIKPNHFKAVPVKPIETSGKWVVISGLSPNTRIVTDGVFFVHSEALKGGFETHNH